MSRKVEVIINSQQDPSACPISITESTPGEAPGVTGFLKINPALLGWLEILTGAVAFGLVFWNYDRWFLLPTCYLVVSGVITATAACTHNSCLVVSAQLLNLVNIFSCLAVFFYFLLVFYVRLNLRVFLAPSMGPTEIAFMASNIVAMLFSIVIFATSFCWCKSRKRVMVIHTNTAAPRGVSDVVDQPHHPPHHQPRHQPTSSPPSYYSPVPSLEPPAYEDERRSTLSRASASRWDMIRWKEELYRSRRPIQV